VQNSKPLPKSLLHLSRLYSTKRSGKFLSTLDAVDHC
jgi:hypothetical protein